MRRAATTLLMTAGLLLLTAPVALANDHGEGWWGETDDRVVTNAGFILIIFFPLFILFASLLQWRLDKRKERRKAEAKRRAQASGGW